MAGDGVPLAEVGLALGIDDEHKLSTPQGIRLDLQLTPYGDAHIVIERQLERSAIATAVVEGYGAHVAHLESAGFDRSCCRDAAEVVEVGIIDRGLLKDFDALEEVDPDVAEGNSDDGQQADLYLFLYLHMYLISIDVECVGSFRGVSCLGSVRCRHRGKCGGGHGAASVLRPSSSWEQADRCTRA